MRHVCAHDPLGAGLRPCALCFPEAASDEAESARVDGLDHVVSSTTAKTFRSFHGSPFALSGLTCGE